MLHSCEGEDPDGQMHCFILSWILNKST